MDRRKAKANAEPKETIDPAFKEQAESIINELRKKLTPMARPEIAKRIRDSFGDDVPCYGVEFSQVNRLAQDAMRRVRSSGLPLAMAIADPLFKSGNIEEGVIANIILSSQARLIGGDDFEVFEVWVKHLTNSLNTDALSSHIVSRALAGKPSLVKNLTIWAKDQSKWLRRAASMSFVPLVREGRFVTDALSVSDVLIEDGDYFVQQGVGNLLMEMTRLNSDRVVEFLVERKDRANPLVLRIASTKLKPEQRTQILNK